MSGIIGTVGSKSGIIGLDVYPTGHVVQTVIDVDNGYESHSSVSWDTVHTTSINNVKFGSEIHIMVSIGGNLTENSGQVAYQIIDSVGGQVAQSQSTTGGNTSWHGVMPTLMGKDTSPLVGTNTYTIQVMPSSSVTGYYNYGTGDHMSTRSYFQLMEVVG